MSDPRVQNATDDDVAEIMKDESKMAIVAMTFRPGVRSMMIAMEWRHFCPLDKGANEKFELILKKWNDLIFATIIVPLSFKEQAEEIAAEFSLRLINGAITMITHKGAESFPLRCDPKRLFNLENVSSSPVYHDPGLFDKESAMLEEFEAEEKKKAAEKRGLT